MRADTGREIFATSRKLWVLTPMIDDDTTDLDLPRLLLIGSGLYSGMTTVMHPLNVMKTRAQAASHLVGLSKFEQLRAMVGNSGVRGLFAGLGPVLLGAIPARASYILALEGVRGPAEAAARRLGADNVAAATVGNGLSGLAAASASMVVYVPVDVVSQKMMVEIPAPSGSSAKPTRPGFFAVVRNITTTSGWSGLYRGIGISMAIGLPAGSIWWATYGAARSAIPNSPYTQSLPELGQKAFSATCAAAATVVTVAPLDTIKTHHQLAVGSNESAFALLVRLVRRDGFLSLYSGSAPRFLHLSLWSTCLICVYEELKRTCRKQKDDHIVRRASNIVRRASNAVLDLGNSQRR